VLAAEGAPMLNFSRRSKLAFRWDAVRQMSTRR